MEIEDYFLVRIWYTVGEYEEFYEAMNTHCAWWLFHEPLAISKRMPDHSLRSEEKWQLHCHEQNLHHYSPKWKIGKLEQDWLVTSIVRLREENDALWAKLRFHGVEPVEWFSVDG